MPQLTITWGGITDARTCPKCLDLINTKASWMYDTGKDVFPLALSHPLYGVVWDCQLDQSRAHGQSRHNCRCGLHWVIDDSDLKGNIRKITDEAKESLRLAVGSVESWVGVKVMVVRDQGRFVTWRPV